MSAPVPASGEFRLDVEAAEEAVRALEEARRKIEAARRLGRSFWPRWRRPPEMP